MEKKTLKDYVEEARKEEAMEEEQPLETFKEPRPAVPFIDNQEKWQRIFLKIAHEKVGVRTPAFQGFRPNSEIKAARLVQRHYLGEEESWVEINPNMWKRLNNEQRRKILKHEAIHYLYDRHGKGFKRIAERINTTLSVRELLGKPAKLEVKREGEFYYSLYKTFPSRKDAREWYDKHEEELAKKGIVKVRIIASEEEKYSVEIEKYSNKGIIRAIAHRHKL